MSSESIQPKFSSERVSHTDYAERLRQQGAEIQEIWQMLHGRGTSLGEIRQYTEKYYVEENSKISEQQDKESKGLEEVLHYFTEQESIRANEWVLFVQHTIEKGNITNEGESVTEYLSGVARAQHALEERLRQERGNTTINPTPIEAQLSFQARLLEDAIAKGETHIPIDYLRKQQSLAHSLIGHPNRPNQQAVTANAAWDRLLHYLEEARQSHVSVIIHGDSDSHTNPDHLPHAHEEHNHGHAHSHDDKEEGILSYFFRHEFPRAFSLVSRLNRSRSSWWQRIHSRRRQ